MVISHGLTATKDDPKVVALATRLHEIGYDVVAYDSRGHGQSGGFCTLGKHEVHDVAALVEWVRSRTRRVVLVGASMGAVGVLSYAAKDSALTGVVAVSSPGAWRLPLRVQSLITAGLARTAPGRQWARRKMNVRIAPWGSPEPAYVHLGSVQCPVVVIHGEQDPIIPWNSSLAKEVVEGPRRELIRRPNDGARFRPCQSGLDLRSDSSPGSRVSGGRYRGELLGVRDRSGPDSREGQRRLTSAHAADALVVDSMARSEGGSIYRHRTPISYPHIRACG